MLQRKIITVHLLALKDKNQHTQTSKSNGPIAVFRCKMAFLKSKFKDDPVRVQRSTVPHFKDLE